MTLALVLLSGCAKNLDDNPNQELDQPGSYIFFDATVNETFVTKTSILTGTSLENPFGILGYHNSDDLFGITEVSPVGDGTFSYGSTLVPWKSSEEHKFYAFHIHGIDYATSKTQVVPNNGNPYINYTQPADLNGMYDILTAYTATKKVPLVPLTFEHRLFALDIEITNNQTQVQIDESNVVGSSELQITSVKFYAKGIPQTAQLFIASGNTPSDSKDFTYTVSNTATQIAQDATTNFGTMLFLPCESFSYRVEIGYKEGNYSYTYGYPSSVKTEYSTVNGMKAGYRYCLTIKKTNDKFFVGLNPTDWTNEDVDHTFN